MGVLILLPALLLTSGLALERAAIREEATVDCSGSLQVRSLWLFGATQGEAQTGWRSSVERMSAERAALRARYPEPVSRTDAAWNEFAGSLRRTGQVDWRTANRMASAAGTLSKSVADGVSLSHYRACGLLAAGSLFALLSLVVSLRSNGRNARQAQQRYVELQISQQRFQAARDGSQDAFYLLESLRDANGRIEDFLFVDINTRAEAMLLRSRPDVIGRRLCDLLPIHRTQGFINKYMHVVETGEPLEEEFELQVEGIEAAWIQHQVVRAGDGIAIVSRDVSREKAIECQLIEQQVELLQVNERMQRQLELIKEQNAELEMQKLELEEANERLAALATTDGLTGLKNHRTFQNKLAEECERAHRSGKALSLLLIDVDHFKTYNDEFGHPAGDHVLTEVAGILQSTSRVTDFVARYGGEEFVIILPYTDAQGAMGCAERLRAAICSHAWQQRSITVSIGASTLHAATQSPATLIAEADQALYISKSTGRDRATHGAEEAPLSRI